MDVLVGANRSWSPPNSSNSFPSQHYSGDSPDSPEHIWGMGGWHMGERESGSPVVPVALASPSAPD